MATPRPTTSAEGDATGIQISPDVSIPESPPGDKANPPGEPRLTESSMLMQMHEFLGKIVEHLPIGEPVVVGKKRAGKSRRRHSRERSLSLSDSSSDEDFSSSELPVKRTKAADVGDSISVTASDEDIRQLLDDPPGQTGDKNNTTSNGKDGEDDLLRELEAALKDEDELGASVNEQLANIVNKRWGVKLTQDKISAILVKHVQPQNCSAANVTRVNPEIWSSLNALQKKEDLRIANLQQVLQKATFASLSNANELLAFKTNAKTPTKENLNEMLANCIDNIALLGHAVSELSQFRLNRYETKMRQTGLATQSLRNLNATPSLRSRAPRIRGAANNTISKIIPLATVNLLFGGAFDQRIARNKQTMCQATEGRK